MFCVGYEKYTDQRVYTCGVSSCRLYQIAFGTSSVISDQATMYTCSLVSVFCSRQFSVKQLKFEINIIFCQYSLIQFSLGF